MPPAWNGPRPRRRPRIISTKRPSWSAARTCTTWRKPKMNPDRSILTPVERDELELTALVRHRLEEQFADLEQQHEAASLGMWIFLATELLFFGTLFLGL